MTRVSFFCILLLRLLAIQIACCKVACGFHHSLQLTRLHKVPSSSFASSSQLLLSDIPPEIPPEIYKTIAEAEANTPAAQGRQSRVTAYGITGFVLFFLGFANGFLTTWKELYGGSDDILNANGLEWVSQSFFLTTKIGGILDFILGFAFASISEIELRDRDDNIKKIWVEYKARREKAEKKLSGSRKGEMKSSKKAKRMAAISEVIDVATEAPTPDDTTAMESQKEESSKAAVEEENGGVLGSLKKFWKEADSMAASQALLLNKRLEDEGMLEKITDESGLKVIGKEAASQLESKKKDESASE